MRTLFCPRLSLAAILLARVSPCPGLSLPWALLARVYPVKTITTLEIIKLQTCATFIKEISSIAYSIFTPLLIIGSLQCLSCSICWLRNFQNESFLIYLRCNDKCIKCKPQWIMIECRCTTPNREKSINMSDKARTMHKTDATWSSRRNRSSWISHLARYWHIPWAALRLSPTPALLTDCASAAHHQASSKWIHANDGVTNRNNTQPKH